MAFLLLHRAAELLAARWPGRMSTSSFPWQCGRQQKRTHRGPGQQADGNEIVALWVPLALGASELNPRQAAKRASKSASLAWLSNHFGSIRCTCECRAVNVPGGMRKPSKIHCLSNVLHSRSVRGFLLPNVSCFLHSVVDIWLPSASKSLWRLQTQPHPVCRPPLLTLLKANPPQSNSLATPRRSGGRGGPGG